MAVHNLPYRYEIFSLVTLRANTGLRIFLIWQILFNPSMRFHIWTQQGGRRLTRLNKMHHVDLRDLCSSQNIVRLVKYRRMRRVGHEVRLGKVTKHSTCWWENKEKGDQLEDLEVNGRVL